MKKLARVLTIAGSDSGGGAGIQADLKTFQAFDVYGMSAITSITAQNTKEVCSVCDIPLDTIADQIGVVCEDIGIDAIKIGMLSNSDIINIVANKIKHYKAPNVVLDPVMVAKSGDLLLQEEAYKSLINKLLPLVYLVTPNIPEAEIISGCKIKTLEDMKHAAKCIRKLGVKNVLIKGGHLSGSEVVDLLLVNDEFFIYRFARVDSKNTHGTGCTLSSAIAACLAKGHNLNDAVDTAREYVYKAITNAPINIGNGHGPLYHNLKPQYVSHYKKAAQDFEDWFNKNKNLFTSEFKALKKFVTDPENCLSVGIGNGMFAEKLGIKFGVEPSEAMAKFARERNISVKSGCAEDIPWPDESFNQVLLGTILASVKDKAKAIKEAYRVLKTGGEVIVSIIAGEGAYAILYDYSYMKGEYNYEICPEYPYPLEFVRNAEWITTEKLIKLLEDVGFKDLEFVQTLVKNPKYTNEEIEEPQSGYKSGSYIIIKGVKK
ncbi:bifunctional hydroxymethylpyrimidine kinase/phosphomethylpyrimidine kinase [Schnuerera sp. xch1]|uniref:bifunctional hydroxymethylpyrimidine kinase/phosphomethylpyrimidine kinase n=1 Tax=Schnuerera sp. xch1 TaxID=2874283 RepID=UPI002958D294|nr:bifunctional hydroxymethylpyrimidine kinase/phosphomethylpyrimidine kinase [Schnuerera sp. xch1]MBZ2174466.1 bifunctional hydroxymethylpyrimidine kinase/phosphomethylpyrimidine kinase [Schnuerera sp. xch1]